MTKPNILELATQGDINAIAQILNQYLQPEGISVQVSRHDDFLTVVLCSSKVQVQHESAEFILNVFKEIIKLNVQSIKTLKIYKKLGKTFDLAWYYEFDLDKKEKFPKLTLAQSKNTNHSASEQNKFYRKKVSEIEFKVALDKCTETAQQAYQKNIDYAKHIEQILIRLNTDIQVTNAQLLNNKNAKRFEFTYVIKDIVSSVKDLSEETRQDLVSSLNIKRKHLEDFTIALFGRTKSGKSTIGEALTRGDGATIGKGSQRTTRDVREYRWQGLRLLDTPGIEAYQGEEDTAKANEVIDQSDMLIFLTSDDSVQPGEFEAMAELKRINKYFAVILNIKHDISRELEDLLMFIDIPEMVFDEHRLAEHHKHIKTYVTQNLGIDNVDLVCIHAQAGFLSTKAEYVDYSKNLWELSKIEELYNLVTNEIYNNGQKRRVSTFFDSSINFIGTIENNFTQYQQNLQQQVKFMEEQRKKLTNIFEDIVQDGKLKLKNQCEFLYDVIKNKIGHFVEKYGETNLDNKKQEWQKIVNQKHIESTMKGVIDEIVLELQEKLKEFSQEYDYDLKNININVENVKLKEIRKSKSGRNINWASVAVGAVGGAAFVAANWWNPGGWIVAAGWISTGVSIAAKVASEWKNREDDKDFKKNIEEEKESLIKQVLERKQETIQLYLAWLDENIEVKFKQEKLIQVDIYTKVLSETAKIVANSIYEIKKMRTEIETDLSNWNNLL